MEEKNIKKCSIFLRIIAKFIDLIIVITLWKIFHSAGIYIGVFYLLVSDGIFKGASIGKKLLRIRVINTERNNFSDFRDSILRNLFLSLALLFLVIPLIGWIFVLIVFAFEFILIVGDKESKRLGDHLAKTLVIEE